MDCFFRMWKTDSVKLSSKQRKMGCKDEKLRSWFKEAMRHSYQLIRTRNLTASHFQFWDQSYFSACLWLTQDRQNGNTGLYDGKFVYHTSTNQSLVLWLNLKVFGVLTSVVRSNEKCFVTNSSLKFVPKTPAWATTSHTEQVKAHWFSFFQF